MKLIKHLFTLLLVLLFSQSLYAKRIINVDDYPYWRELSQSDPFYADMSSDAIRLANRENLERAQSSEVLGANALAYILDSENKDIYVKNIEKFFKEHITKLEVGDNAVTSSVLSHELFFALLALDVVGDELKPSTLKGFEKSLGSKILKLVIGKWDPHGWAMRMLWYKYIGDEANFLNAKQEWEIGLSEHFMPDGVSPAGSTYCVQRWTSVARSAKNLSYDIMEYMGYNEYYTNPAIVAHQEFLYGYAIGPAGRSNWFGDSRHVAFSAGLFDRRDGIISSPTSFRAARLSQKAYEYSMWAVSQCCDPDKTTLKLKGLLPNYLIMAGTAAKNNPLRCSLDDRTLAPSRIFDNYASFVSNEQSSDALMLSMQNLRANEEYHTHYEVNAVALAGYGEIILRNGGYAGPDRDISVGDVTATFDYLHYSSESASCVMLGGERHASLTGDGVVEGFAGYDIEYARASTGADRAIKGCHLRDVIFMQPSNGVNGYYIIMDHVKTNVSDETVNVLWHPNAAKLQPLVADTEYLSEIKVEAGANGPELFSDNEAKMKLFLGTIPSSIDIKKTVNQENRGGLPADQQTSYVAEYMAANYQAKGGGVDILTAIFPGDKNHEMGEMSRLSLDNYSGVETLQSGVKDVALVSSGDSVSNYSGAQFQGEDVVFRRGEDGGLISYFVKGNSFCSEGGGFESDSPVALHLKSSGGGMSGVIISKGAVVTIYQPAIRAVALDGRAVEPMQSSSDYIKFRLPVGEFKLDVE